jgi:hypothetical protein
MPCFLCCNAAAVLQLVRCNGQSSACHQSLVTRPKPVAALVFARWRPISVHRVFVLRLGTDDGRKAETRLPFHV